ncbi:glycine rich domain-containing protein [Clostridioides difficile]|uniref:glycine rich domain-containing protein n=1 Tax=Clostridioides difficile TaxID=1496 RepID=UPI00144279C7|nr:glycine rich domain-containing protein [Clostridioides difficile]MCP8381349.1 glycine-rich protein [Clostridioides difficile]NKN19693.1 hypothetical protein [Clostridioides difficile]
MATEWVFNYTGTEQSITLSPGKYVMECWGACGGNFPDFKSCAKGGYAAGILTLKENTKFYIYVGQGGYAEGANGIETRRSGFNGAGGINLYTSTSSGYYSLAGGGSTDIRLTGGAWDNPQGLLSRIMVAGGAGGSYGTGYYSLGHGGGLDGKKGVPTNRYYFAGGGSQFEGGSAWHDSFNGSFGFSPASFNGSDGYSLGTGGGGGWYGGAGIFSTNFGGGGSSYILTKDSYKPPGYIPTSKYYFNTVTCIAGKNESTQDGFVKFTLLQALPFLTVSSYNSTQATFKAEHTIPSILTKIEWFLDDVLKETITTDLTLEKTINYTLEDNALHTLKIVVTDSANATVEKVLSISKNIMPLPEENVNLNDISTKLVEVNAGFKTGKTSIINTLALKNIEASLNNTLVELSEKIKTSFDSTDASVQELQNRITELTNQLSQRKRWAKGTSSMLTRLIDFKKYKSSETEKMYSTEIINLAFEPTLVIVIGNNISSFNYSSNVIYKKNEYLVPAFTTGSEGRNFLLDAGQIKYSDEKIVLPILTIGSSGDEGFTWYAFE